VRGATRAADRPAGAARYDALPGSAAELAAIAAAPLMSGAAVLTQAGASETALRGLARPRLLHLATHGFFAKDPERLAPSPTRLADPLSRLADPLLRSGLALAGANLAQPSEGDDDGELTALEVTSLDLDGTELVVLSACETGVGDVRRGEGVFGLQRAFMLAGARALVMSLWKVDDAATSALMSAYYARLSRGEGRAEALRQLQLAMIAGKVTDAALAARRGDAEAASVSGASGAWSHPYFWASFVMSGDAGPLRRTRR
jgi:CHAT domain-containing protein